MRKTFPRLDLSAADTITGVNTVQNEPASFAAFLPQPIHTVYGGAHLFGTATPQKISGIAMKSFRYATPAPRDLRTVYGITDLDDSNLDLLHHSVEEKLLASPVEDYRIDFEDGYGFRSDAEEDGHAATAAAAAASLMEEGNLPENFGIRIKPMTRAHLKRNLRTLEIFFNTYLSGTDKFPRFIITLPKIETAAQADAFRDIVSGIEASLRLAENTLRTELMIENTQSLFSAAGGLELLSIVRESGSRLLALHAGLYDFTASLGILATDQKYTHPACDTLRFYLRAAASAAGVRIADGATVNLPLLPKEDSPGIENREKFISACAEHFGNVRHSIRFGIFQGWDLHPAQIPPRLASVFLFILSNKKDVLRRLASFLEKARAVQTAGAFDDAATAQGLVNFAGWGCHLGLIGPDELKVIRLDKNLLQQSFSDIVHSLNR